jgi:hypothetical protein
MLGDIDADAPIFQDETLDSLLAANSNDLHKTAAACAASVIAQLSRPDYQADWLKVEHAQARESWEQLLWKFQTAAANLSNNANGLSVRFMRGD